MSLVGRKMHRGPMPWKHEYGDVYSLSDNMKGGNYEIVYPILKQRGYLRPESSLLSIGGGFGTLEYHAAKDFRIKLGFVEPTPTLFQLFEKKILDGNLQDLVVEKFQGAFQDFESQQAYDCIVAIHSWYYIGCDQKSLAKAIRLLRPGGKLFIVLSSWESILVKAIHVIAPDRDFRMDAEDLSEWLKEIGVEHDLKFFPADAPLNRYFVDGNLTPNARDWIAYMSRTSPKDVSEATIQEVREIMLSSARDGRLFNPWGAIEILNDR